MADLAPEGFNDAAELQAAVEAAVRSQPVLDMHTHLYPSQFGSLNLWGIDELLTYHYLIAEYLRFSPSTSPRDLLSLPKPAQADFIWRTLFVENSPLSEATCGIVTVLRQLGLDTSASNLDEARDYFRGRTAEEHVDFVLGRAGVSRIVMTNDPFDDLESKLWLQGVEIDSRFLTVMRMDPMLNDWTRTYQRLQGQGYQVTPDVRASQAEATRFVDDWISRIKPEYLAVSLPPQFAYPEESERAFLLDQVILPVCREHGLPFALMIGVRRAVNPALELAGDGLGKANISNLERLCETNPANRFLVTMLSLENQHELCVAARKFSNLMPFGCWWFLNNPSLIEGITTERFELLGASFIPQHSDARVLDQLLYKWPHSRNVIATVLNEMLHLGAVLPNLSFAADAHYHHLKDDVIVGGKFQYEGGAIKVPTEPGLGVKLDRAKVEEYAELYKRLGSYPYDQDPLRKGWTPCVPNNRWADPSNSSRPEIPH